MAADTGDEENEKSRRRQLCHIDDELCFAKAILRHTIPERQAKYLKLSPDTSAGTFRIVPHNMPSTTKSLSASRLRRIKEFEFFMWTNIEEQPTLDYIKKRIAHAADAKTSDFAFETSYGIPLNFSEITVETLARLSKPGCHFVSLEGKPLVEIHIVPKENRQ